MLKVVLEAGELREAHDSGAIAQLGERRLCKPARGPPDFAYLAYFCGKLH